jgi:hypothetical protein
MTENILQTSQGYIFRILQHFVTILWNITNFVMLFQAVMTFLLRSKFSLLRKWSISGTSTVSACRFLENDLIDLHVNTQNALVKYHG